VIDNGRRVACLMVDAFEVFIVLLADDVILMPETVVGLQTRLNSLQHAVSELKLKVNMNKNNLFLCLFLFFVLKRWLFRC